MSESNDGNGTGAMEDGLAGGKIRMWIGGVVFVAAGVVTFIAGDENRWISIPAAIVAAIALVDLLSVRQRRRRANSE